MSRVTLKDIAKATDVSIHTVSDILNGDDPRYNKETRRKVLDTAERLEYRPNRQARLLRGKESGVIGLLKSVNVIQTGAERALFAGEEIYRAGYDLLAYDIYWHSHGLERAVDFMLDSHVEGILLCGPESSFDKHLDRLRKVGIPMVSMGGTRLPNVPHVSADLYQGGKQVAEHLISTKYRNIAFLMSEEDLRFESAKERLAGIEEVLHRQAIPLTILKVKKNPPAVDAVFLRSFSSGTSGIDEILKADPPFDALICVNDYSALAAIRACHESGIRIPEDLAVVGFDDTAFSQFSIPTLTTLAQPTRKIASAAVDLLIRKIQNTPQGDLSSVALPCELVIRESCPLSVSSFLSTD